MFALAAKKICNNSKAVAAALVVIKVDSKWQRTYVEHRLLAIAPVTVAVVHCAESNKERSSTWETAATKWTEQASSAVKSTVDASFNAISFVASALAPTPALDAAFPKQQRIVIVKSLEGSWIDFMRLTFFPTDGIYHGVRLGFCLSKQIVELQLLMDVTSQLFLVVLRQDVPPLRTRLHGGLVSTVVPNLGLDIPGLGKAGLFVTHDVKWVKKDLLPSNALIVNINQLHKLTAEGASSSSANSTPTLAKKSSNSSNSSSSGKDYVQVQLGLSFKIESLGISLPDIGVIKIYFLPLASSPLAFK